MRDIREFRHVVYLCEGEACARKGSESVVLALREELARTGRTDVHTVRTRCSGFCARAPVACVQPDGIWYGGMDADAARRWAGRYRGTRDPLPERRFLTESGPQAPDPPSDLYPRLEAAKAGERIGLAEALDGLKWDAAGLVPVVAQDALTGRVLMLAWCDRTALEESLRTRLACFWSRSRGRLWRKGETSGNMLDIEGVEVDCDGDALVFHVHPRGPVCHTGRPDCFYHDLSSNGLVTRVDPAP